MVDCPFRVGGCCQRVAEEIGRDLDSDENRHLARVTDRACGVCQDEGLKNLGLNQVISSLAIRAANADASVKLANPKETHFQFLNKWEKPVAPLSDLEAADRFPCVHRGSDAKRIHTCKPCLGRRELAVYGCQLKNRECTVLSSDALDRRDQKRVEVCHLCDEITESLPVQKVGSVSAFDRKNSTAHKPPARVPGMLVSGSGINADALWNFGNGREAFLLCCGPSLKRTDLSLLDRRGIFTMAINNQAANSDVDFRPSASISMDTAGTFHPAIWQDPGVMSFTNKARGTDILQFWDSASSSWVGDVKQKIAAQPNVWLFDSTTTLNLDGFLTSRSVVFGGDFTLENGQPRGTLNTMLPALRILHYLGFRSVYLLGCDFWMEPKNSYAFETDKGSAAGSNNTTYGILNNWFGKLRPVFEKAGFFVFNSTAESNLTAFDYVPLEQAVGSALRSFPSDLNVNGLYGSQNVKKK